MSRYPYTEAADYIRRHIVPTISRSDAAAAYEAVAKAIGISHDEMAHLLADYARGGNPPAWGLKDALCEARTQIEILHERLGIKDTGHGTLSIIDAALAKAEGQSND